MVAPSFTEPLRGVKPMRGACADAVPADAASSTATVSAVSKWSLRMKFRLAPYTQKTANGHHQNPSAARPPGISRGLRSKGWNTREAAEKVKGDPAHSRRIPLPEYRPP